MGKVICIANQKGGVGKTTTALALANIFQTKGYRTLMIDTDPQANTSSNYGAVIDDTETLYEVLMHSAPIENVIQHTAMGDIVPGDNLLKTADAQMVSRLGREYILRDSLAVVKDQYDFIIIDTPPAFGILSINAYTCADGLIVPTTLDRFALEGMSQLYANIYDVKRATNPNLICYGIVHTQSQKRTTLEKDGIQGLETAKKALQTRVFASDVPVSVKVKEAQARRVPLIEYAPKSKPAIAYMSIADELLNLIGGQQDG